MEFNKNVVRVKGLASYKTSFNPSLCTYENACTGLSVLNLPRSPVFLLFYSHFYFNFTTNSLVFSITNLILNQS